MNTYVIFRRAGWPSAEQLKTAAARSNEVGEEMSDDIRWLRSYVLKEPAGAVGAVCVYQASSPEAVRQHAAKAHLPVDEIVEVLETVIVRPDEATVAN